jgi:hypothetical protein
VLAYNSIAFLTSQSSDQSGPVHIKTHTCWISLIRIYVAFLQFRNLVGILRTIMKTQMLMANKKSDKTKYMVVFRGHNARRIHIIKIGNSFSERVEQFRYLGITLTNHNSIQKEIRAD